MVRCTRHACWAAAAATAATVPRPSSSLNANDIKPSILFSVLNLVLLSRRRSSSSSLVVVVAPIAMSQVATVFKEAHCNPINYIHLQFVNRFLFPLVSGAYEFPSLPLSVDSVQRVRGMEHRVCTDPKCSFNAKIETYRNRGRRRNTTEQIKCRSRYTNTHRCDVDYFE